MASSASPQPMPPVDPELEKKHALEKQFHVKNIPIEFDDWAVFDIFRKFGLVDNVRLPPVQQPNNKFRFGFVSMLTYEGADNVRAAMTNGSLTVADNILFKIENVNSNTLRAANDKENQLGGRGTGRGGHYRNQRAPFGPLNANGHSNRSVGFGTSQKSAAVGSAGKLSHKWASSVPCGELPNHDVEVIRVEGPAKSSSSQLRFWVKRRDSTVEAFSVLYQKMVRYVEGNPIVDTNLVQHLKVAIVREEGKLYRAEMLPTDNVNSAPRAFLVDEGRSIAVVAHETWPMPQELAATRAMVYQCAFAGLSSKPGAENTFNSVFALIDTVCAKATLRLRCVYVEGNVNFVKAFSIYKHSDGRVEEGDIGAGLAEKEFFEMDKSLTVPREYSRDAMMEMRKDAVKLPFPSVLQSFPSIFSPNALSTLLQSTMTLVP